MSEFLSMGGYALYVWPSFGLFLLAVVGNVALPWWQARRLKQRIAQEIEYAKYDS